MPIKFSFKEKAPRQILLTALLVIGITIAVFLSQQPQTFKNFAAGKGTTLVMIPNFLVTQVNQTYEIQIGINTEEGITAAEVHLKYDPGKIRILNLTKRDFLDNLVGLNITDSETTAAFLQNPKTPPAKGYGYLAKISVMILSDQDSEITFGPESKITTINNTKNNLDTLLGIKFSDQKFHPEVGQKGVGDLPVPSGVVYINPSPYVRDYLEAKPTEASQEADPQPAFSEKYIKYLIKQPFILIGNFNKDIQQSTKKLIGK